MKSLAPYEVRNDLISRIHLKSCHRWPLVTQFSSLPRATTLSKSSRVSFHRFHYKRLVKLFNWSLKIFVSACDGEILHARLLQSELTRVKGAETWQIYVKQQIYKSLLVWVDEFYRRFFRLDTIYTRFGSIDGDDWWEAAVFFQTVWNFISQS